MEIGILVFTGFFAGFIGSLFGLGGGIVIVPVLTLIFGMSINEAIGTSLVSIVAVTSVAAVDFLKSGRADMNLGLALSVAASAGAMTGAIMSGVINDQIIYLLFSIILFIAAVNMLRPTRIKHPDHEIEYPRYISIGYGFSFLAGNISGLLGVGGGIIQIPLMRLIMGVPLKIATATSSFMIAITVVPAASLYLIRGDVDPFRACAIIVGTYFGSQTGAFLSNKITVFGLRLLFVILMLFTAYKMLLRGL
jgi:uncharacterized membrane protein YfcA